MNIQVRLIIIFIFFSLAPVVCIEIYAYHVYAGSINVKVGTSAEKALLP